VVKAAATKEKTSGWMVKGGIVFMVRLAEVVSRHAASTTLFNPAICCCG
jgi:hypothetical protein